MQAGTLGGNVFCFDSKCIHKDWVDADGKKRHARFPVAVSVNPEDNIAFEDAYFGIMCKLFQKFGIERNKRVHSSSEIGMLFPPASADYRKFCLAFTREIMNLPCVKFTFFITSLNKKYLNDGKVTVNGEYGSSTKAIGVEEFINLITDSYNVICAWKLSKITNLRGQTMIFDGTDSIRDCEAWDVVRKNQNVRIIYNADKTVPAVSTADIILKNLDFFIKEERAAIDEKALRKIIHYGEKVTENGKYYYYVGNPDLKYIKPKSDRVYSMFDLRDCIQRPIIYLYAGGIPDQKSLLESFADMCLVYDTASAIYGSVKIFDPKKDNKVIGTNSSEYDYFYPFNDVAESTLQVLEKQKRNIKRFEP
ncbi:MAG: hypothetical protein LBT41_05180 [Candidatus Methanoplasma sp.]|jgi:hypothetical protein|nr:hypothetical protein [Candidatus Methanoplasma sp.]